MKKLALLILVALIGVGVFIFFSWDILARLIPPNSPERVEELVGELAESNERLPAPDVASASPKLMIIVVDALSYNILELGFKHGLLPNLKRIFASSCAGMFLPSMPMRTPRLLTSMATGVPPEMHGILDFTAEGNKPVTGGMRRYHAFWHIASERGLRVAIVGWPFTWPAEEVNGYFLSAPGLQDLNIEIYKCCHASEAKDLIYHPTTDELDDAIAKALDEASLTSPELPALPASPDWLLFLPFKLNPLFSLKAGFRNKLLSMSLERDTFFLEMAKHILSKEESLDIFAVYLESSDVVGHLYFHDPRRVLGVYSWIDGQIGELMELVRGEPVMIVTGDHGMRATKRELKEGYRELVEELDWPQAGVHDPIGAIAVRTPKCSEAHELIAVRPEEIAPFVLALFGIQPSSDMQSPSLAEQQLGRRLESGDYSSERKPIDIPILEILKNPRITEDYKDQLKALGYL